MKTSAFAAKAVLSLFVLTTLLFAPQAKALDSGIDPANLGKGDWIYVLSTATNKLGGNVSSVINLPTLMTYYTNQGVKWISVKAGTGSTNFPTTGNQFTTTLVNEAHAKGLKVFGYTRSYGDNIPGEIALADLCFNRGADGFIIDAEVEWESGHQGTQGPAKAIQLASGIKANWPTKFLAHAPAMYISLHSSFPMKEFNRYCDAVMPQCYWVDFGITPSQCVTDLENEWKNWQSTLSGTDTNSIIPIVPVANAYHSTMPASEITTFLNGLKGLANPATFSGYKGISYWRADLHTTAMWNAIRTNSIGKTGAATISGVVANELTDVKAIVGWRTDIYGDSVVEYGLTTSYGTLKTNATMDRLHSVTLNNLSPSTTYHFRVKSKNVAGQTATSGDFTFTTLPAGVVNDIIVDNTDAAVSGSWSTGATSTDKFNADYRYTSQGAGSDYLLFEPNILKAGDYNIYEWHPQGGNRTVGAPHVISYNGGSITVNVNQQLNGGMWNLLGTFNLTNGMKTSVKITDGIADAGNLVMADAIKFSYVQALQPPAAPSGLTATAIGTSQINLTWADNSSVEDNVIVARSTTSGGPYTDIATLAANTTSYNNTGLAANTTYYYVVRAVNAAGASPNSNQASATTAQTVPAAPGGLTATAASQTQIDLAWTDNSSNESNFIVGRSTTSGGPYTDIATLGANVTSFSNTGLTANTTYYYVVRASNGAGSSANSAQASATTLPNAPAAPSGLSATAASQTQINLSWLDNSSNESNFTIARSTTSGGPYTDIASVGANVTSFSNTGLTANTTYYYVVRASNVGGSSANSAEASATTLQSVPTAPSGLIALAVNSSRIDLSWTDNSSNESNFIVGRSTTSGGPYTDIATLGANVVSYSDTGLAASTTYYYVVRASNASGSSANSAQASATTIPSAPSPPGGLVATAISSSQINLSWTDNSPNESNFVVARGTASGGPYTDVATLGANVTSYSDTGLAASTTYFYVVRASNAGGASPNSNEASATTSPTPPAAPSGLVATAISSSQINLAWTDNSANEANFIVARSTTSGGPYTDIATLGANVTSYSNTGLAAATTYYYVVRASNAGGTSANSAQANATTVQNPPAAPSGLTATAASSSQINLAWTDNSANETSFIVGRSATSGGPYTDIATLGANVTSYNDTGLAAATTYFYVVRASNAGGSSANSAQGSATTQAPPSSGDIIIDNPAAIVVGAWSTGTTATDKFGADYRYKGAGTGTAYLQFTPTIATNGTYDVYEWHAQGSNRATDAQIVVTYNGGTFSTTLNQQVNGGTWVLIGTFSFATGTNGSVKITDAFTGTGVVMADAIKFVYNPTPAAPTAPSGLTAAPAGATSITLNWVDGATSESGFTIARSTTSGGPYTDIGSVGANVTTYTDATAAKGTAYFYVVRATNAGGSSANSAQASATIPADIIIDNPAATVTGTWTTGTGATDKFGTDYRYKGPGTGTVFLTYTPTIGTAGQYQVYEWHSQGTNRTTDGKHVVTYNGGSQTIAVNQQINGGKWNLLGTFNFAAGSAGNIKINDNYTTGSVVICDGIKFVYVSP